MARTIIPILTFCLLLAGTPAQAHFQNFLARIVHIEARDGGTLIHARLPLASVLLPHDWNPNDPLRGVPYVQPNSAEDRPDALLLDTPALQAAPQQLEARLAQALQLVRRPNPQDTDPASSETAASETAPVISAIRIQPVDERSPFTHLPQIRAALSLPLDISQAPREMADALVDFRAFYPDTPQENLIEISSSPDEWPVIAARSINIITLYKDAKGDQGAKRTRLSSSGVLAQRLGSDTQPAWRLSDSLGSGFQHVLIGLDHVLFMIILILAARHWRGFMRNSLAFTLGHSITLAIGAAGLLGTAPWFIPLIETAIALSILYSGACLLLGLEQRLLAGRVFFIGLLHGLGFAFMLQQASGQAPQAGNVGAGAGALVGKLFGIAGAMKGGIGSASLTVDGVTVGALVACNALGDVVDPASGQVLAGARLDDGRTLRDIRRAILAGDKPRPLLADTNTTLGVLATDAVLTKAQAHRLAQVAHDGLARAINPVHTMSDGDTVFAMGTGRAGKPAAMMQLATLAAEVTARAVVRAVLAARGITVGTQHWPAAADLATAPGLPT